MPQFAYTAKNSSGEAVEGKRSSANAGALAADLRASGLLPVRIEAQEEAKAKEESSDTPGWQFFKPKVKITELVVFCHQMASLTKAGVPIVRAIRTLAESQKSELLASVLIEVAADLEAGMDIASSMDRRPHVFPELFVSLIHVGENTGRLDEAFSQIANYLELERETRRRIQAATRYPSFVMITMALAIVILNVFVIPAFAGVFEKYGADLPWQTQAIIGVSDFFVKYWPVLLLLGIGAAYAWRSFLKTDDGLYKWHYWKMRLPMIGSIFERVYLTRFCNSFAMVSRAGVPVSQGLAIVARAIGSEYMARKIDEMRTNIERGESISVTARQANMFSPVVLQMMSVGEETGAMDDMLAQAASFYEEEVEYDLKGLTDALEPILIVGIAILVLIMALGVFLPLWDLSSVTS